MYRRVMVTSDGSDLARAALPHALELARAAGATVVAVAVIPSLDEIELTGPPHGWVDLGGSISEDEARATFERSREVAALHVAEVAAELRRRGAPAVEEHVLTGAPGPAIVAGLDALDCDVVVMSTHGRSGVRRALLGSVADHVVTHAHRPVLLVPPAER